mmetsp:Transcript_130175/g.259675  ORF Transcript_130175/g.259675 Transcript_130175/m.259675 type:complete len:393 (+) Transcript_130175:320-1498(+)
MESIGEMANTARVEAPMRPPHHHQSGTSCDVGSASAISGFGRDSISSLRTEDTFDQRLVDLRFEMSWSQEVTARDERDSANIKPTATQSTQPCAPPSHAVTAPGAQPLDFASGPRNAHAVTAPPSIEMAGRGPMIIPCPTYAREGRRVQCQVVSAGSPTQLPIFKFARAGRKKPANASKKDAAKAQSRQRQRARQSSEQSVAASGLAWSSSISLAVAVPDGNGSFSTRMVCRRSGTAKKTPKYVSAAHQIKRCHSDSFTAGSRSPKAGTIPTKPPANGIVAVATLTVCSATFSCGPNGFPGPGHNRNMMKPTTAAWMEPIVTQPVCRPKCMLVKQSSVPTRRPPKAARAVNCGFASLSVNVGFELSVAQLGVASSEESCLPITCGWLPMNIR